MARANVSPTSTPSPLTLALRRIGIRFLVHFFGLCLAIALSPDNNTMGLLIYLGTICLLPRGDWRKPDWLFMLAVGVIQAVVAFFLTGNIGIAIFLGGCQSWLQRILLPEVRTASDWMVSVILAIMLTEIVSTFSWLNWVCIAVLAVAGYLGQFIYKRIRIEAILQDDLRTDVASLKALCLEADYPGSLLEPSRTAVNLAENLAKVIVGRVRDAKVAIQRIHLMVQELRGFHLHSKTSRSSGWAYGLLQGAGKKYGTESQVLVRIQEFNIYLTKELRKFNPLSSEEEALETKWLAYEQSAQDLQAKATHLPENLAASAQNIAQTTYEIIKNMRHDPADRAPGERFLDRYLPAAHKIVDEYMRLSQGTFTNEVQQALNRSTEVLGRMEKAFKDELSALLENDAINFTAEVDALDVLLKMRGN